MFPIMANPLLARVKVTLVLFLSPQNPILPYMLDLTQETMI